MKLIVCNQIHHPLDTGWQLVAFVKGLSDTGMAQKIRWHRTYYMKIQITQDSEIMRRPDELFILEHTTKLIRSHIAL